MSQLKRLNSRQLQKKILTHIIDCKSESFVEKRLKCDEKNYVGFPFSFNGSIRSVLRRELSIIFHFTLTTLIRRLMI